MPTFSTSFTPPAPPANLTIEAIPSNSSVELTWTPTSLGVDFDGYRVYRSDAGGSFKLIASIVTEAVASYVDFEAPLDVQLTYRLTVLNPDFESDPSEASTTLDERGWYLVTPNFEDYTFRIRYVTGFRDVERLQRSRMAPLGRTYPVIVAGVKEAAAGSVSLEVHLEDAWLIPRIRELAELDVPYVLMKTAFGDVYRVKLDPEERSRAGVAGIQLFSFGFDVVA